MKTLFWELTVLGRAVVYANLSAAADHIGVSQPQLSRIVRKLEDELNVTLLDRAAKRKSAWTPMAKELAGIYTGAYQKVVSDIQTLVRQSEPAHLKVGALEGMAALAARFCRDLRAGTEIRVVQLDIEDLDRLDERFTGGELDLIFTFRLPGPHKKFRYLREVGYQTVDLVGDTRATPVQSTWEFSRALGERRDGSLPDALVSNSLAVREVWLTESGARGTRPSPVGPRKPRGKPETVHLVGADRINARLWRKIEAIKIRF